MAAESVCSVEAISALLRGYRFTFSTEAELQAGIERVLRQAGIEFRREAAISREDRPDFMIAGGVAIECKTNGGLSALTRQIHRYAQIAEVTGILVVTTRMQHRALATDSLNGKPVRVHHLMGSVL